MVGKGPVFLSSLGHERIIIFIVFFYGLVMRLMTMGMRMTVNTVMTSAFRDSLTTTEKKR